MTLRDKLKEIFKGGASKSDTEVYRETILGDEQTFQNYLDTIQRPEQALMALTRIDGMLKGFFLARESLVGNMDRAGLMIKGSAVTAYQTLQRSGRGPIPIEQKQRLADFAFDRLDRLSESKADRAAELDGRIKLLQTRKTCIEDRFGVKRSTAHGMSDRAP